MSTRVLKAVALLELTGTIGAVEADNTVKNTMGYYWTTTKLFDPLSIYDTEGSLTKTLQLLDKYYNEGYRIFIGFSRSTIVAGVLNWFTSHPDAIGISIGSSSDTLAVPKSIYRLQIVDSFVVDSMSAPLTQTISEGGKIFYVYSKNEVATENVYTILKNLYGETNVVPYVVENDSSNLTVSQLQSFYTSNNVSSKDSVVIYLIDGVQMPTYVNLFTTTNSFSIPAVQYNMSVNGFSVIDSATTTLTDKYFIIALESLITSEIFNQGLAQLAAGYSANTLNALYLSQSLQYGMNINNLFSYAGTLEFDSVTRDIKYGAAKLYLYKNPAYDATQAYTDDPLYGDLTFYKVN